MLAAREGVKWGAQPASSWLGPRLPDPGPVPKSRETFYLLLNILFQNHTQGVPLLTSPLFIDSALESARLQSWGAGWRRGGGLSPSRPGEGRRLRVLGWGVVSSFPARLWGLRLTHVIPTDTNPLCPLPGAGGRLPCPWGVQPSFQTSGCRTFIRFRVEPRGAVRRPQWFSATALTPTPTPGVSGDSVSCDGYGSCPLPCGVCRASGGWVDPRPHVPPEECPLQSVLLDWPPRADVREFVRREQGRSAALPSSSW